MKTSCAWPASGITPASPACACRTRRSRCSASTAFRTCRKGGCGRSAEELATEAQRHGGNSLFQLVDLGGQDEIALHQPVDLVGPDGDLHLTPGEADIGMVALCFGDFANFI